MSIVGRWVLLPHWACNSFLVQIEDIGVVLNCPLNSLLIVKLGTTKLLERSVLKLRGF